MVVRVATGVAVVGLALGTLAVNHLIVRQPVAPPPPPVSSPPHISATQQQLREHMQALGATGCVPAARDNTIRCTSPTYALLIAQADPGTNPDTIFDEYVRSHAPVLSDKCISDDSGTISSWFPISAIQAIMCRRYRLVYSRVPGRTTTIDYYVTNYLAGIFVVITSDTKDGSASWVQKITTDF